jgi:predicted acylesterase/phospholipase RssA
MSLLLNKQTTGLVLSGGGSRAAYQAGTLKAMLPIFKQEELSINIIVGSSIGAVNGLVIGAALSTDIDYAVDSLINIWEKRTYRNTFSGHPSRAFLRAIKVAISQFISPGPKPTTGALFDPTPLRILVDHYIHQNGGLHPEKRASTLSSIAVMTTLEGVERKPLLLLSTRDIPDPTTMEGTNFSVLYVPELSACHGLASAALPSILPPVEIELEKRKVRLVDGGISQNVPIDPAVRLGARNIISIDISGRDWWLSRSGKPEYTRPDWEVPADEKTFCPTPGANLILRCKQPLGPALKLAVGSSTKNFMRAVGPVWPLFLLLKKKLGEDIAYEVMSYVALDPDYQIAIIEQGYNETKDKIDRLQSEQSRFETKKLPTNDYSDFQK